MSSSYSSSNSDYLMVGQYFAERDNYRPFSSKYSTDNGRSWGQRPDIYFVQGPARIEVGAPRRQVRLPAGWLLLSLASCLLMLMLGLSLAPQQHLAYPNRPALITAAAAAAAAKHGTRTNSQMVYYVAPRPPVFNVFPTVSSSDGVAMDTFTLANETFTALGYELASSLGELGFQLSLSKDFSDRKVAKLPENLRVLGQLMSHSLQRSLLRTQWLQTQSRITPSSRWITEAEQHRNNTGHYEGSPRWCRFSLLPTHVCMDAAARAHRDIQSRLSTLRTSVLEATAEMSIVVDAGERDGVMTTAEAAREQTCGQSDRLTRLFDKLAHGIGTWRSMYQEPAHVMVRIMPSIEHVGRDGVPDAWYILAHNESNIVPTGADMCVEVQDLPELQATALAMAERGRRMCSTARTVAEHLGVALGKKVPEYQEFLEKEIMLVGEWERRLKTEGHSGFQGGAGIELANWFEAQIGALTLRWEEAIEAFQ